MATLAQLMQALPEQLDSGSPAAADAALSPPVSQWKMRPVPLGRIQRMGLLGALQTKIAAAYLFYWVRGWFTDAASRERMLAETHWRTAARVLDSMNYLRGATMKLGQTLANFPDILPARFAETLDELHFSAPPMHWSLLREMAANELGHDVEDVFARFEKRAFAAASLGQVHRAILKGGQDVAVKIQYPGIARTLKEDFDNFFLFLLPSRLGADWEQTREQFDDLRLRLAQETDYRREAATLQKVGSLFRDEDGIVVPRVYPEHSTGRVLTMERLDGVHLDQFLASSPSQELRNAFAEKMLRAWYRMFYAGRVFYLDLHPGNFLFMDDGRLGVIDFGCMMDVDDALWEWARKNDRPMTTGRREDRIAVLKEWLMIGDDPADAERLRLADDWAEWQWHARANGRSFDFGDEADFRRGIDLFVAMARKRYTRGHRSNAMFARYTFALRAMLHRLKANINVAPIAEEEVRATGWDRSDYAPR